MNFIDTALIKLADPTLRNAIFDQTTLELMADAAYDASALSVTGPFSAVFDKLTLGHSIAPLGNVEGSVRDKAGMPIADVQLQIGGLGPLSPARVDAIWRGSIIAQTIPIESHITSVQAKFATDDIDAGIINAHGALPTDPTALEAARRGALMAELSASMAQPTLLTDAMFDDWLREIGVSSVSDLITNHRGSMISGVFQVRMSAPSTDRGPTPKKLPIVAAILIRDQSFSLAQLLMESKLLREQLLEQGMDVPTNLSLPARKPFLVIWIIPVTVFDDTAWPGTGGNANDLRVSRRHNASLWLAPEGIAIAVVDTS